MDKRWLYLLAWYIVAQPLCTQAVWKQIAGSPFTIKAEPENGEPQNGPRQVAYSPDGAFLAVANARDETAGSVSPSGSVSIFSVNTTTGFLTELDNSPFSTDTISGGRTTIGLAFSPLGTPTLATANIINPIKLFSFNNQTGELFNLRPANSDSCPFESTLSLAYSPAGTYLIASTTPNVYQVNQATGDLTCQQQTNSPLLSFPRSIAYYPLIADQSYVAITDNFSTTNNLVIFTVDSDTGILSNPKGFNLRAGSDAISPHWVDFSPDGRFIAVAVIDGVEVRKFRATGFNAPNLLPLNSPTSFFPTPTTQQDVGVRSVAYSPDGRWLAAANGNETASVFCVDQETGALFNRQDLVIDDGGSEEDDLSFSVIFSPDSRFLAVSNRDDNSISVFTNPGAGCPTCTTMINLLNNNSCAACTATQQES